MLHKDEIKILRIAKLAPILIVLFYVVSIIVVYEKKKVEYQNELQLLKSESTIEVELLIKSEVLRVYDFISAERALTTERIKSNLQQRVQEAEAIAMSIYKNNQHLNPAQLKKLITDALREIRFNDGRGYFFIYDNKGTSIMHPISPQLQNSNLWDFQDKKGTYVIRELSHVAKGEEGGALTWWWNKPADLQGEYKKMGYSKQFAPFDWFIGTGDYIDDYEGELKQELLQMIANVEFGQVGNLFIVDKSGAYLSQDTDSVLNQNRLGALVGESRAITQEVLSVASSGQGFISYFGNVQPTMAEIVPKRTFVKSMDDWPWVIGSSAYLNNIDELVLRKKIQLNERNSEALLRSVVVSTVASIILFIMALFFSNVIKKRFLRYQKKVSQKNIELKALNANLEQVVLVRTKALEQSNQELESTLAHLKSAQNKILETEKMASMVGLVSGIAHELNTPLGNMVTSITQVEKEVDLFFEKLSSQTLTRKDLKSVQQTWSVGYQLLSSNLLRAVNLVDDFKSLSTHDEVEGLQLFSMNLTLETLHNAFLAQFEKRGVEYVFEVEDDPLISSYQSIIINVLSQLINNSLTHAFESRANPAIKIKVREIASMIQIHYADNGVGSDQVDKIFEPFYTTKRGAGCTGLGLPIVYNQVTHKLQGSIDCSIGKGEEAGLIFNISITKALGFDNNCIDFSL